MVTETQESFPMLTDALRTCRCLLLVQYVCNKLLIADRYRQVKGFIYYCSGNRSDLENKGFQTMSVKSLSCLCRPNRVCDFLRKVVINTGLMLVLAWIQSEVKIQDLTDRASTCLSESLCIALKGGCYYILQMLLHKA